MAAGTVPRPSPASDGERTRTALVDTAAALFAEFGVDAVSVRAVNKAAGAAPAATHYHFGSRDGLLQAVLLRDGAQVLNRVAELAGELAADPVAPEPRELVDAVAQPYRELLDRSPEQGRRWLQVVAQLTLAEDERLERTAGDASDLLAGQVVRAFPAEDPDRVLARWSIAVTTLIQMLGRSGPEDDAVDAVVDFVVGGLTGSAEE